MIDEGIVVGNEGNSLGEAQKIIVNMEIAVLKFVFLIDGLNGRSIAD
ncbi:MAG: hypothetical protein AAGM29_19925 [Cyanobacteria bacterium J06588_4]